ncbi:MAG: hypothetical protein JHD16_10725 [Solirubrobacteraceae bacterium]|nr:hypothetical protein [Solirubrobacteraceae bacterium]
MRRLLLPWLLATLASFALIGGLTVTAASATAATKTQTTSPVRFAIADQHTAMFTDPRWQQLGLRLTRYNVPWDAATDPFQRQRVIDYVTAANAAGVKTLVHLTGQMGPGGAREALPTRAEYRTAMRALVALLRPMGVTEWGAWNEANHSTQPTIKRPDRAAQFFLELRAACTGCTIVAVDLLTQGGPSSKGGATYRGYLQRFMTALGSKRSLVKIIGVHNYGELIESKGPYRSRDLMRFARRYVKKTRFWMTESGGVAATRTRPCNEARQVTGNQRMFSHARTLQREGLDRLYHYNWTAHTCTDLFDSGLIRADGTARPALDVIQRGAAGMRR